nr:E3 ubiquitin-protein ligase HOS1 [Ipomoea batatas]GMD82597.1 E3 ubiquitin-protein ligase HOS1 [Ipomoea batatas]
MERRFEESSSIPSHSTINGGSASLPYPPARPPNYTCGRVQGALELLASIDPIELCDEAKVEHCRATRDLRSCGRHVQSVLSSCGHASLCEECSQRCDVCPICRVPLPKDGNRLRLRIYYECIEAGLISKRCDDRKLTDVTDVCMDESAVSSDPVIAFLLDEVVVKDWCKRTFRNILAETQVIYNHSVHGIEESLSTLLKLSVKLSGLSNVIEVLESSFKHSLSAKLHDLHHLQECILKTKQHMDMMIWCTRHKFLENVSSRFHGYVASWRTFVCERKSAAIKRAWPDSVNHSEEASGRSTLFIEDALTNLESDLGDTDEVQEEFDISCLQKDGRSSFLRLKIGGMAVCYPFENLRAATDILFLQGSSDLVVAKQAIWTVPDEDWRYIIDDFATTFCVSRHSILESLVFFLLDDHSDEALQEACRLLPEISSPTIHPKVAQVLLERENPDAALMVLRWSGRDGVQLVSLGEAVTAVRVRVECGLLSEAFMYQRMVSAKVMEKKLRDEPFHDALHGLKDEHCSWDLWVETLVSEICCLCIRRNLVDRIIELPWNSDEERYLHKCLFDFAIEDPSAVTGSLLVVYYLQRYRYIEAYEIDRKLQSMEESFISQNSLNGAVLSRIRSVNHWRVGLVGKGIELLPGILQHQVKTGKLPEVVIPSKAMDISAKSDVHVSQGPILPSLLAHPPADHVDNAIVSPQASFLETPSKFELSNHSSIFKVVGSHGPPSQPIHLFDDDDAEKAETGLVKSLKFHEFTPRTNRHIHSPNAAASLSTIERSSSRVPRNSRLRNYQTNKVSSERVQKVFLNESLISNKQGLLTDSVENLDKNVSAKRVQPDMDRSWILPSNDSMDFSWSHGEDINANGGSRWRSDDTSEDEDYTTPDRLAGFAASHTTNSRGVRRGRFSRR